MIKYKPDGSIDITQMESGKRRWFTNTERGIVLAIVLCLIGIAALTYITHRQLKDCTPAVVQRTDGSTTSTTIECQ